MNKEEKKNRKMSNAQATFSNQNKLRKKIYKYKTKNKPEQKAPERIHSTIVSPSTLCAATEIF